MISTRLLALISILVSPTGKYYYQNNEKIDHDKINTTFQKQSQEEEKGSEKLPTTLTEQKKEPDLIENVKPELKKNSSEQNQRDGPFFKPAFPALSLDTVFFILLIHICGAELVGSISTVFDYMSFICVLVELVIAVYARNKWKREKAELVKKNTELQKEKEKDKDKDKEKDKEQEDVITTLMEVKTKMENQMGQLKVLLEEVEREREGNKQKLQAVEKEITEREMKFEKPEELLKEKETLLLAQWKLDQTKKDNERQLLNYEKLLEPIETRTPKEADMQK